MPKTPITERTMFYSEVRGGGTNKALELLDWNAVETELGTMVEPRNIMPAGVIGSTVHQNVNDNSFNRLTGIDSNTFYSQFNTSGEQLPRDYNA